jgi:two-component system sensor histidine kinase KdpD
MRSSAIYRAIRCGVSAGIALTVITGATHLHHVNHTTIALGLVLLTLGFAMQWGWSEALASSLAGGLGFDYFFLPARGLSLESPEHLVTLLAFLLTAITTGGLASRANRHRTEAEQRNAETGRLYQLGTALRDDEHPHRVEERITDHMVQIFGVEGAAFFDLPDARVFRSGADGGRLPDAKLREVASSGIPFLDEESRASVVAIRESGKLAGSLGVAGPQLSRRMLEAVAERVGVAIAKSHAERQSMEAELARRSENLKSAVLDALAHEIKGPLATVKVSASTLLSNHPGDAMQQRELLRIIDEEADRMKDWIDDAVQMSSREASELQLRKTPSPVKEVVERAMEGLGLLLEGRPVEVDIGEALPLAVCDAEMIEKVIRQLLDNAIKYSPSGSPIRVCAEFTGAEIIISVADSGCGIPKSDQQHIFEKYYRGSNGGSDVPGTGLGLPSAKCILEAHGGEIWVNSAPGSGSVFRISLPVMAEAHPE